MHLFEDTNLCAIHAKRVTIREFFLKLFKKFCFFRFCLFFFFSRPPSPLD